MLAKTLCFTLLGLEGFPVEVEVDINYGLPGFDMVGLPDAAVKESKERVRSAIKNMGRFFPTDRVTVNLAPAELRKEGSHLDLPIAVGILAASGSLPEGCYSDTVLLGELSLDGSLRAVKGIMPILISAAKQGFKKFIIPRINAREASYIRNIDAYGADNLKEVLEHFSGEKPLSVIEKHDYSESLSDVEYQTDISLVKGQATAKRALEIAVSGGHNILFIGVPGTGKTMLARCIPTIMPALTFEEALETTKIHSVAGCLPSDEGIISRRPFMTPHHTATSVSIIGGGQNVKPGIVSLAHNGVLFLDEMPEYTRSTLEALRQPLEDGVVTVSRAKGNVEYPAKFILCGSMNPCPCGNLGSKKMQCKCTASQIQKYRSKISGPLLDRIDIQVEVDSVEYGDLRSDKKLETSKEVRHRVNRTRTIQRERFEDEKIMTNAEMTERHLKKYCKLSEECEEILMQSFNSLNLSARARSRIIKVARTIADVELSENIETSHILEAIGYRSFDRSI